MIKKFVWMLAGLVSICGLSACGDSGGASSPAVGAFSLGYISDDAGNAETALYDLGFGAGEVFTYDTVTTSGVVDSGTGTYVNNADGSLVADGVMEFRLSGNGKLLGAVDSGSGTESIMVGVKQGSGLAETVLDGDYSLYQFGAEGTTTSYTVVADATFNGAGATVSVTGISLSDGTPVVDLLDAAYTVSDSGLLQIPDADLTGQVSSSGQVVVMVDTETTNSPIQFGVMVKKVDATGTAPLGNFLALQYLAEIGGTNDRVATAILITLGVVDGSGDGLLDYQDLLNPADSAADVPFNYDSATGIITVMPGDPQEITGYASPDGTAFVLCDNDDNVGTDSVSLMVGMKL